MSETSSDNEADPNVPAFWTDRPDKVTKVKWQEALSDYLISNALGPDMVEFSIELVKECLPFAANHDQRWKDMNPSEFNMALYPAHYSFYNVIRNKLVGLKTEF